MNPYLKQISDFFLKANSPPVFYGGIENISMQGKSINHLVNGKNAFVVDMDSFFEESVVVLTSNYINQQAIAEMAKSLHEKVIELFGVDTILMQYDTLNSSQ